MYADHPILMSASDGLPLAEGASMACTELLSEMLSSSVSENVEFSVKTNAKCC